MPLGPMPTGIPGGGLPPGGLPPGIQSPPGNLGPVTIPQSNQGNMMKAVQQLAAAHKMIMEALPQIPLGSESHDGVMSIATKLGKIVQETKQDAQMNIQTLMQAMKGMHNDNQMAALAKMAPPQPNQPPATALPRPMAPPPAVPVGASPMAA